MCLKNVFISSLLATLFFAGAASATTYTCRVKPDEKGAWIPTTLVISHSPSDGKVVIFDEYINTFIGKPISGKVGTNNSKRIAFNWVLKHANDGSGHAIQNFRFRATYYKASNKVTVTSQPGGYANNFRGRGSCTVK